MSELLKMSRVTADAECFYSVKPPMSFGKAEFLGNAVTSTHSVKLDPNGKELIETRDWIHNESIAEMREYFFGHQLIITYNGLGFDYPLWGGCIYNPQNPKARNSFEKMFKGRTIDLCKDFNEALGVRVSLENVSIPTLGDKKEMEGGYAPDHWRAGRCLEVIEYCRGDIRRTDELFKIAASGGELKVRTKQDDIRTFKCTPKIR